MRFSKNLRFGRYRIQGFADVFNVLNAGTVVRVNETYSDNPATNTWLGHRPFRTAATCASARRWTF